MANNILHLVIVAWWIAAVTALRLNEYYSSIPTAQTRLIRDLLAMYHKSVPPTHEGPVNVKLGFTVSYFGFVNEAQQQAVVHAWSSRAWTDPRLRWDPEYYNGTTNLLLDIDQIWVPDLELYNGATMTNTVKAMAVIYSDGSVSFVPSYQINFICDMNLRFFPYDKQTCLLKMGSWHYHSGTVNLTLSQHYPDLSHMVAVNDFMLEEVTQSRSSRTYACCLERYIDVTYNFTLSRRSAAYSAKLVLPSVLGGFLVLGSFLIPHASCEKITFCVVLLLGLIHLLTYLHDIIPTSGDTVLGQFLAFAIFLDFFAIILAVVSYNLRRSATVLHQENIDMDNDVNGSHDLKIRTPPNRKRELIRYFDIGCFVIFSFIYIIGLAVILGRRG